MSSHNSIFEKFKNKLYSIIRSFIPFKPKKKNNNNKTYKICVYNSLWLKLMHNIVIIHKITTIKNL